MQWHRIGLILTMTGMISLAGEPARWNQFRGPNGSGVANDFTPPIKFDAAKPTWKVPLPSGKSSPVLHGNKLFITAIENKRLMTLAFDRRNGTRLWKKLAPETKLESVHDGGSPAACTPCVDPERVYVYFGSYGLLAYDHDGNLQWKKPVPTPSNMFGIATSPILYKDTLILVVDDRANLPDSKLSRSRVMAMDKTSGTIIWETPRPYNRDSWATPMIWKHEAATELIVLGSGRVYSYNPDTGDENWFVNGFSREAISTPVAGNGHLHVSSSMQGGTGDASMDPEPFWTAMLHFDKNGDQRIGRDEITEDFTMPFRPELPPGHPGFGFPLPRDPEKRRKRQQGIFGWRDKNRDGFWTREEFLADMRFDRMKPNLAAIKPGGRGNVTETHVVWNFRRGIPEIPSPAYLDKRLYLVRAGGLMSCVDADTGKMIYRERLNALGQYAASPVIANHHVYLCSSQGVVTVVKTGDTFNIAHQQDLDSEIEATPALDRNTLYIRTADSLIAFRQSEK